MDVSTFQTLTCAQIAAILANTIGGLDNSPDRRRGDTESNSIYNTSRSHKENELIVAA